MKNFKDLKTSFEKLALVNEEYIQFRAEKRLTKDRKVKFKYFAEEKEEKKSGKKLRKKRIKKKKRKYKRRARKSKKVEEEDLNDSKPKSKTLPNFGKETVERSNRKKSERGCLGLRKADSGVKKDDVGVKGKRKSKGKIREQGDLREVEEYKPDNICSVNSLASGSKEANCSGTNSGEAKGGFSRRGDLDRSVDRTLKRNESRKESQIFKESSEKNRSLLEIDFEKGAEAGGLSGEHKFGQGVKAVREAIWGALRESGLGKVIFSGCDLSLKSYIEQIYIFRTKIDRLIDLLEKRKSESLFFFLEIWSFGGDRFLEEDFFGLENFVLGFQNLWFELKVF